MCYTATDSLLGYIINSIGSILLYNIAKDNQFKVMALFLLFVGQMQILDFTFWKIPSCNSTNKLMTKLAIGFNHLQPGILCLLQTIYGFKQSQLSIIILTLYFLFGLYYNFQAYTQIECTKPENGVMKWDWNHLPGAQLYYFLFLSYLIIASFNFDSILFQILSAFVTVFTFFMAQKTPVLNISVGRIWCYYAALMPVVFIGLYYFNPF